MKRILLPMLALTLLLCACAQPAAPSEHFAPETVQHLLDCGAFSEPIDPLEADIAWGLYRLSAAGLSREDMTQAVAYRSSGATCEELALLTFRDAAAALTATQALEGYLADQILANRDYRPAQIPKLEQAQLLCRGNTVLLLVANDYSPTAPLLNP